MASFGDFASKRDLKTHVDKICGSIYYLREVLKLEKAGELQVATCYQDQNWDWPTNFKNMFSQGKTKNRLVYEKMDDVKLTAVETNAMKKETSALEA